MSRTRTILLFLILDADNRPLAMVLLLLQIKKKIISRDFSDIKRQVIYNYDVRSLTKTAIG